MLEGGIKRGQGACAERYPCRRFRVGFPPLPLGCPRLFGDFRTTTHDSKRRGSRRPPAPGHSRRCSAVPWRSHRTVAWPTARLGASHPLFGHPLVSQEPCRRRCGSNVPEKSGTAKREGREPDPEAAAGVSLRQSNLPLSTLPLSPRSSSQIPSESSGLARRAGEGIRPGARRLGRSRVLSALSHAPRERARRPLRPLSRGSRRPRTRRGPVYGAWARRAYINTGAALARLYGLLRQAHPGGGRSESKLCASMSHAVKT
jgi:hypothetical protein